MTDKAQPTFPIRGYLQTPDKDYEPEEIQVDTLTVYAHGALEVEIGEWKYYKREIGGDINSGFWCREFTFRDRVNHRKIEINEFSKDKPAEAA